MSVFGVKVKPFCGGGCLLNQRSQIQARELFLQFGEIGGDFRVFGGEEGAAVVIGEDGGFVGADFFGDADDFLLIETDTYRNR